MTLRPNILIVDDERQNREILEVMLSSEGFHLSTAVNGEEALATVAGEPPDLILLDIMMPGMDGYQVASAIKHNPSTKNIPIIMITALHDRESRILGLNAGAEDFLTKPVDRAELSVRVRNLLRLKSYGDYYDKYSRMLESEMATRTADLALRTQQAAVLADQAALLDLTQDAIIVRDMLGRIVFWSRGAQALYGWSSHEAIGRDIGELLQIEGPEAADTIEATLLRDGQWQGEATHRKSDGTRVSVASRWALQRGADDAPVRILAINSDITDRRRAESDRHLLTERLSLATAVAKVGVWEWDLNNHMLTWDATMFEIYGVSPVVPMPYATWSSSVHPKDLPPVEARLRKAIEEKGNCASEYRISLPDGTTRNVSRIERVVLDEHGNVGRMIGVDMDVTERRAAERALEQVRQDQMRFKDEFLSHVSHELRTPLTAIKQFSGILLRGTGGELNAVQREYQLIVLKNIQQLQVMIDDLLEVTRLESGKLTVEQERMSIVAAVTDSVTTLQMTADAKAVTLTYDLPSDLPLAFADETRLRQILIILLDNAIKFTPGGGTVHVEARRLHEDAKYLLIEVSDSGCGFGPEMSAKMFKRLYQAPPNEASRKGLGLGLYICKELVVRQGGGIWARSRPEEGSTFAFTLPVFALDTLVAPLHVNGQWPSKSLALIALSSPGPWRSKEARDQWSLQVRNLVERCLLPDLDILVPRMSSDVSEERLFVAAFADQSGASILAKRIQEHCERHMDQPRRAIEVTHTMLQLAPHQVGAANEITVSAMATCLEEAIDAQLTAEVVHHG